MRTLSALIMLFVMLSWQSFAWATGSYELLIKRSEKRLIVQKEGQTIRSFHVALGSGGRQGKEQAGDRRTPMGEYHITQVRDSNTFYMFLQLDYPSVRDAINALKSERISKQEYRKILDAHIFGHLPPQNTSLGGAIGIHGIGVETEKKLEIHQLANWTQGCIALRNEEIDLLIPYIQKGTTVKITE